MQISISVCTHYLSALIPFHFAQAKLNVKKPNTILLEENMAANCIRAELLVASAANRSPSLSHN